MGIAFWIMVVAWIFVLIWVPFIIYTNRKLHPRALFVLFFAEMWERFSYYGMRALLTLYMVQELFSHLGQGEADKTALGIYGSYTAMVYFSRQNFGVSQSHYVRGYLNDGRSLCAGSRRHVLRWEYAALLHFTHVYYYRKWFF